MNQEDRDRIEGLKQEERDKATSEIEGWKSGVNKERSSELDKQSPVEDVHRKSIPLWDDDSKGVCACVCVCVCFCLCVFVCVAMSMSTLCGSMSELTPAPVRGSGKIPVSFTPRLLPTAVRESRLAEEEEVGVSIQSRCVHPE